MYAGSTRVPGWSAGEAGAGAVSLDLRPVMESQMVMLKMSGCDGGVKKCCA